MAQTVSPLSRDRVSANQTCLPTGVCLDPTGRSFAAGNMPLGMVLSPEGDRLVLSLNGWRQQGIQVVDRHVGKIVQRFHSPAHSWAWLFQRMDARFTLQAAMKT